MFYSLELQMAGVILFTAMAIGGISLWVKRRKLEKESVTSENDVSENDVSENDVSENIWYFSNLDNFIFKIDWVFSCLQAIDWLWDIMFWSFMVIIEEKYS